MQATVFRSGTVLYSGLVLYCGMLAIICSGPWNTAASAADWPMWRYDAGRTAASPAPLPEQLQLQWQRQFAPRRQAWDDPLNLDLMTYDRLLEPIVVGQRLFVGFNDRDRIAAFDITNGRLLWEFCTDGPVRLPLAATPDSVFCVSDDGYLYCIGADDGQLQWRFRGGPGDQRAIGNQRLISAWPSRGGPVVRDGQVYFAASIWPFMGTFIYSLDAVTGDVVWVNDETGAQYIKQPHSAPSFAGVAPQGALVATQDALIVPGGRSVPAVFDRQSGALRYFEINAGGKGTGGSFVAAHDKAFFVHTRLKGTREFALDTGLKTAFMPNEPVLTPQRVYSAEVHAERPVVRAWDLTGQLVWEVPADGRGDLILAGNVLYAAGPGTGSLEESSVAATAAVSGESAVAETRASTPAPAAAASGTLTAIRLPAADAATADAATADAQPQVLWTQQLTAAAERLVAAQGMLFAVTLDGQLLAYGAAEVADPPLLTEPLQPLPDDAEATRKAASLLAAGDPQGYALWFGAQQSALCEAVATQAPFSEFAVIDPDVTRVTSFRERWDKAGLYGRLTAHVGQPLAWRAPPYIAHMVFVGPELSQQVAADPAVLQSVYNSVRPYGGVLQLLADAEQLPRLQQQVAAVSLEQAEVSVSAAAVVVRRVGALPGSADWTHQHGNIANTIKSDDQRVRLPLGILWFGGSSNTDVLPRHGHGPPEQVVGGRLIIQGMNSLSARDVYTGRVLWKREFADLGTDEVYYDETYKDAPLDPSYNQVHIPGANARGTNYVVTEDRIYVVEGSLCHVLDPATGETLQDIALPQTNPAEPHEWGFIGVYDDVLIGGVGFARYQQRLSLTPQEVDGEVTQKRAVFGSRALERAGSQALVGFDRHTGRQLWQIAARHSFWHNGIVAGGGRVYVLDRNPKQVEEALKRRGRALPQTYRIAAFDAHSGELRWETSEGIFGTWLGYSAAHDLLLQAGAAASDRLASETGQGMAVYQGQDGTVVWRKDSLSYAGPCILHNDLIITNANAYSESAGAFYLRDGSQKMTRNPLTGRLQPWKITRAYGCNNILASEHLLTFRSGAAGFYDLLTESGTGNLGGFKSGCTSNLVVANGVLNAPDYTRTCSCAYQNQTSLALVHMPELDVWTIDNAAQLELADGQVQQLGVNLGAPGDRRDQHGRVWLEYPVVAGESPGLPIEVAGPAQPWQDHSARHSGSALPWVLSSGLEGLHGLRVGLFAASPDKLSTGLPVQHADDDAEEDPDGSVSLSSSDLELVHDSADQRIGVRFERIPIAAGAAVRGAWLQFTCHAAGQDPTELVIRAQLSGDAPRFSDQQGDISRRPLTTAQVVWRPEPWTKTGEAGPLQRTPDLTPLIREVIQQTDWRPGQAMVFVISGQGKRVATAFAKGSTGAVRLVVDADETPLEPAIALPERAYRVRLYFGTPAGSAERRVFDVAVQGQTVLTDVVVGGGDGQAPRELVHSLERVPISDWLDIQLTPREGRPVLSGIELQQLEE